MTWEPSLWFSIIAHKEGNLEVGNWALTSMTFVYVDMVVLTCPLLYKQSDNLGTSEEILNEIKFETFSSVLH